MDCPTCKTPIPPDLITRAAMSDLGKRGRGPKKARTTTQARKAAHTRWNNHNTGTNSQQAAK